MGRSTTPAYRIEFTDGTPGSDLRSPIDGKAVKTIAWNFSAYKKPSAQSLERFIRAYAQSLQIGGANDHISRRLGHIPYPTYARVVGQTGKYRNKMVAEWRPGPFLIW